MQKILSYPITVIFYLFFGFFLVIFQAIQWVCYNLFGYEAHKRSVAILNWFLIRCTNILGTRYTFENKQNIPTNKPLIIVSNHQSMFDIPAIIWYMRKYHPKFVSKKELGKGIPSISFNLKYGGSVLIDRKNSEQAVEAIEGLGAYIEKHNRSAVIFAEGTRSRNGKLKPFKTAGLEALMRHAPSALIVPISINNSWKLFKYGNFPMGLGTHIKFNVHQPFENKGNPLELIAKAEDAIKSAVFA